MKLIINAQHQHHGVIVRLFSDGPWGTLHLTHDEWRTFRAALLEGQNVKPEEFVVEFEEYLRT